MAASMASRWVGLVLVSLGVCKVAGTDWNYDYKDTWHGPLNWSLLYDTCAGNSQSPINIDYNTPEDGFDTWQDELDAYNITRFAGGSNRTMLNIWDWNGHFIHHFDVKNNGHSIALTPIDALGHRLNSNTNGHIAKLNNLFGNSDESPDQYCLDSLHFHWGEYDGDGSEHTQYGKQYPAEVHFVHYSCDFENLSMALAGYQDLDEDDQVLAVVGFLFDMDESEDSEETSALSDLLEAMDYLHDEGDTTILPDIKMVGSLIPKDMQYIANGEYDKVNRSESTMWYYMGSLTTPGCYQIARWHLFDYKLKMTHDMLEALRSINGSHGTVDHNWRPIQANTNPVYRFEFASASSEETTLAPDLTTAESSDLTTEETTESSEEVIDPASEEDSGEESESDNDSDRVSTALIAVLAVLVTCLLCGLALVVYTYLYKIPQLKRVVTHSYAPRPSSGAGKMSVSVTAPQDGQGHFQKVSDASTIADIADGLDKE